MKNDFFFGDENFTTLVGSDSTSIYFGAFSCNSQQTHNGDFVTLTHTIGKNVHYES